MDNNKFDFGRFKVEAIKGLSSGKPINGENGIFAPLMKPFLEAS
nr:hypothetical protein [Parapedobacter tibetensis]